MKTSVIVFFIGLVLGLFPLCSKGAEQVCSDSIMASTPTNKFIIHDDGTVSNLNTGLMWMRCSLGQTWDGKTCQGDAKIYSWPSALKAADGFEFAGHDGWRLPNKNDLESIVEVRCSSPSINSKVFPATPAAFFWTSSPYAGVSGGAWSVDFAYGTVNASVKNGSIYVRLVRGPE